MARRGRRHRLELNADVNVVSLIDVMLLLLVIFMITAPLMQGGVDIELPKTSARPLESKDGMNVTIDRSGRISVDGDTMTVSQLRVLFASISKNRTRNGVYLRADKNVPYGVVAQVLAIINVNGVPNIGLVNEPEEIR